MNMLLNSFLIVAFVGTVLAQAPEGYRKVFIASKVDTKYVVVPKTRTSGSTIVVQTKNDKPEQHWYIKDNQTKIQLVDTMLCIDAGAKSNWKDMASITLKDCSDTEVAQKWVAMSDGRIALEASSPQQCIDLQYMRATPNNPVGLYSCAGLGNTGAADKGINWPLLNATALA
ncbi:hypothetical protein BS50DRAFT_557168 [Corynespora cassiicola Philippines]|uniref:Ricin B lectin domain-containing protein n=1 Tax=Corynespora cassiicola Philippines TaxID=1448308 RepID=A0A2T2NGL3_CORCC|nr:hypothetical protein BS50DRAFT_557168 [Corynespora cassiicola Philippines]